MNTEFYVWRRQKPLFLEPIESNITNSSSPCSALGCIPLDGKAGSHCASVCPLPPGLQTWWTTWSLALGTASERSSFGGNHLLTNCHPVPALEYWVPSHTYRSSTVQDSWMPGFPLCHSSQWVSENEAVWFKSSQWLSVVIISLLWDTMKYIPCGQKWTLWPWQSSENQALVLAEAFWNQLLSAQGFKVVIS